MAEGILGKLKGLLSNPTVQGIAGAAAFGANPLLGLLAAPGIASARDRRAMENEEKRASLDRRSQIEGLLSGDLKTEPMAQPSARISVPGIGPMRNAAIEVPQIGDSPGLSREFVRRGEGGGLMQTFDRRPEGIPQIATPGGMSKLQGLLAAENPGVFAQGLLASQGGSGPTAFDQKLSAFQSFFPEGVPENPSPTQTALLNFLGAGRDLDPNLTVLTRLTAEQREREARNALLADQDRVISTKSGLTRAGKRIEDIAENVHNLGGTFLQPGLGAAETRRSVAQFWAAIQQFAGGGPNETQMDLAELDKFTKNTANLLIEMSSSLSGSGGLGTITDSKMDLLTKAMANEDIQPQAIIKIIQEVASDLLVEEEKLRLRNPDFRIPNREFLEVFSSGGGTGNLFGGDSRSGSTGAPALPFPASRAEPVEER